jgi:3',5'-cyclic AMP phosphodiesterase CpdA
LNGDFILAQLSDMHVTAGPQAGGFDSGAQLRRALSEIGAFRPHAILATGDLANDARADEYEALAAILRGLETPLFLLPGNHDDRGYLKAAFPEVIRAREAAHLSYVVDEFPLRLICLDQVSPGAVHGEMTSELAAWLDDALAAAPERPTLIAMHHPPFLTHDLLFDRIGLRGPERFAEIVAKHRQVLRILCGHHHRSVIGQVAHAPVICAPSTAWGFSLAIQEGQEIARKRPEPGWALHVWRAGSLATHIMPLAL